MFISNPPDKLMFSHLQFNLEHHAVVWSTTALTQFLILFNCWEYGLVLDDNISTTSLFYLFTQAPPGG